MRNAATWVTKRKGKRGVRYLVRWIEPETGKNRGKTFRRLEDARIYEAQLKRDIRTNEYFVPVKIGYREWVDRHLAEMCNSPDIDVSSKTIAGHSEALDALEQVCNPKSPLDINPKMIREFRRIQLAKNLSINTVNKQIRHIRSALSYAVRSEIIPTNKLLGPHRLCLKTEEKALRILEVGEVIALLNVATDLKHKVAISLAYYHGLRRAEICFLWWEHIDLQVYQLSVISGKDNRTKTRRSRMVALREETAVLLDELYRHRRGKYVFGNPKVFYWQCGKWFSQLVHLAGIDHCTLHDLRKTCNTRMLDAGIPQSVAMQVLGHSTASVNQRHYTGILMEQQRIAVKSLPSIG